MASILKETELAVRTDNAPGAEGRIMSALLEWGVQVRALCSYAEGEKLMVLVVADDAQKAKQALACAGFECKVNPVILVGMENRVGAMARLGGHLKSAGVEILYSYASYMDDAEMIAVFKTRDDARALAVLQSSLLSTQPSVTQTVAVESAAA
jgi:hypothetical protein